MTSGGTARARPPIHARTQARAWRHSPPPITARIHSSLTPEVNFVGWRTSRQPAAGTEAVVSLTCRKLNKISTIAFLSWRQNWHAFRVVWDDAVLCTVSFRIKKELKIIKKIGYILIIFKEYSSYTLLHHVATTLRHAYASVS